MKSCIHMGLVVAVLAVESQPGLPQHVAPPYGGGWRSHAWLNASSAGACSAKPPSPVKVDSALTSCELGSSGSWKLRVQEASSWARAARACQWRCAYCSNCATISLSLNSRICAWHRQCNLSKLHGQARGGYRSGHAVRVQSPALPLSGQQLSSGVLGAAESTPLRCFARQLLNGKQATIGVFGTSVTSGPAAEPGYPAMLSALLKRQFPSSNVVLHTYGYPGASTDYMRACISRMVPVKAGLYLVESVDNMGSVRDNSAAAAISDILDSLQARLPTPGAATMLLAPFPQSCTRRVLRAAPYEDLADDLPTTLQQLDFCESNRTLAAMLERLGAARRTPAVSARLALAVALRAHPTQAAALLRSQLTDTVHPNAAGNLVLAQLIAHALAEAANNPTPEAACPSTSSAALGTAADTAGAAVCAFGDDLKAHVKESHGWRYTTEYSKQGHAKPGYVAETPGAQIELCFAPKEKATRANWQFAFLRSYAGMGKARGECFGSCSCAPRVWNAHIKQLVSQPHVSKLKVQLDGASKSGKAASKCACTIRLTVLNETYSSGHKFKLVALFSGFYMYSMLGLANGDHEPVWKSGSSI